MVFIGENMQVICTINTYDDGFDKVEPSNIITITNGRNDGIVHIEHNNIVFSVYANELIFALERCKVYNNNG